MHDFFLILHILNNGGPVEKVVQAVVEIVYQHLSERLYITKGGIDYIRREIEYLLLTLAEAERVTGAFIATRVRALAANLLRMKLACPRREKSFSSLLPEDQEREVERLEAFLSGNAEPIPAKELREVAPPARSSTRDRGFRLARLRFFRVGVLKSRNVPERPVQQGLSLPEGQDERICFLHGKGAFPVRRSRAGTGKGEV